jgi:CVNH domain
MFNSLARLSAGCLCLLLAVFSLLASVGTAEAAVPTGSYQQSCTSIQVNGTSLTASCNPITGDADFSTIADYTKCVGDIANFNGTLTCSNTAVPTGSYRQSCRFVSANADGSGVVTLYANCETTGGLWNSTQLSSASQCTSGSDIANLDGTLACNPGPGVHGANPIGSYSASCRNIWTFAGTLNAECQTASGGWIQSQIAINTPCTAPTTNFNGLLVCSTGTVPNGSFAQSCTVPWVSGNASAPTLNALCKTAAGSSVMAQLVGFNQCQGDIANFDGVLACNIGGQPPTGSYSQTCRDIWLNGTVLNAECKNTSGTWLATNLANVNLCDSNSVSNNDGVLGCSGGEPNGGSFTQSCRNLWILDGTTHAECKTRNGQWMSTSYGQSANCLGGMSNNDGLLQCPHFNATNFPASYQVAGVALHDQEQSYWCWAGSGQTILQYFGFPVRQCDEVLVEKNLPNCCGYPVFSMPYLTDQSMNCQGCNCGGGAPLSNYGLISTTNTTSPLSWSDLQAQFANQNEPIVFAWNWCGGGAHVPTAFGYTTAGGNQVWVMDPEASEPYLVTYDEWAANPNGNGTCTENDTVGHAFQVDQYDIAR